MSLRRTCADCGGTRRRAFWRDAALSAVIARCRDCGANFNGDGVTLPPTWATSSALGLSLVVDPGPEGAKAA
jgi:hypothetical protein